MGTKEKKLFDFVEIYLRRARDQFIDWLENTMERKINVSEIDIYCRGYRRFDLVYKNDQISIKRICYSGTSIDTVIKLNSKNYNTSIIKNN